jgi:imidazole glycerol-phosphate synthase subunit HisF
MIRTRIIPCLQLIDQSIVKTKKFSKFNYVGDPINTVKIFNELEVDELCFLDIRATINKKQPNFKILKEIANECFMPLSYGGNIRNFDIAKKILSIGFEKIIINSYAVENPNFIKKLSKHFGCQAIIISIDVKKNFLGNYHVYINDGKKKTKLEPVKWAKKVEKLGAGELLLTSIDKEGTWEGFDTKITKKISQAVKIPVIANGGAGNIHHIYEVIKKSKASAVALGSMLIYQKKNMGILINFPDKKKLFKLIEKN